MLRSTWPGECDAARSKFLHNTAHRLERFHLRANGTYRALQGDNSVLDQHTMGYSKFAQGVNWLGTPLGRRAWVEQELAG